ncbi:MAG TPA: type II secretion system protein [Planctomycetota bacterium]|nr:type II secretion system protein [Planctomycetota bacterium]
MRRAFTLIEMLLSIAIAGVICSSAFVAIRVASQAVVAGTRLSIENQLMRAGVSAALEDLDSWASYDDPSPAGDKPLRAVGHPFGPLPAQAEDFNFDADPVRDAGEDYEAWWRRDSRSWARIDTTISYHGTNDQRFLGDYRLFGKIGFTDPDEPQLGGAERRWRHRLVKEVSEGLGYYAMLDYAPPSIMFQYYDESGGADGKGRCPPEFADGNGGGMGSACSQAVLVEGKPFDFVNMTVGTIFSIIIPSRVEEPRFAQPGINKALFLGWYYGANQPPNLGWGVNDGYPHFGTSLRLVPLRPASWPNAEVRVRHYAANARQFHSATVVSRSALTGESFKLYLTYTGTTLRGARMAPERNLDGAAWVEAVTP